MELKIYARESAHDRVKKRYRSVTVESRRSSQFYVSVFAAEELRLEPGKRVLVAHDEDSGEWYLSFGEDPAGSKLSKPRKTRPGMNFSNARAAAELVASLGAQRSVTLLLDMKGEEVDGVRWHRLLKERPLRKR